MGDKKDVGSHLGDSAIDKGIKKIDHKQDAMALNAAGLVGEIMAMKKILQNPEITEDLKKRTRRKLDIYNTVFTERNPHHVVSEEEDGPEMTNRILTPAEADKKMVAENLYHAKEGVVKFLLDIDSYIASLEANKIPIFHPKTKELVSLDKLKDARKTMEEVFNISFKKSSNISLKELRGYWNTTGKVFLLDVAAPSITSAGDLRKKFKQAVEDAVREIMK